MSRNIYFLILTVFIFVLLCACSPKNSEAPPEPKVTQAALPTPVPIPEPEPSPEPLFSSRVFRLSDSHPDGYPTVLGDLRFAELVSELTDDAWTVMVYNNSELGGERSVVDQVQMGTIDLARVSTGALGRVAPEMNVFSLPYLFRNSAHMFSVLDGQIGDDFLSRMYKDGLLGLCWFDGGTRGFYNTKQEIHTPVDMLGMKIRVQDNEPMTTLVTGFGAEAVTMAYSDIYDALLSGEIDGAEGNGLSFFSAMHDQPAKFYTNDAHIRTPETLIISTAVWETMTPDEQIIIKQCALEAALYERDEWQKQEAEYDRLAEVSGVTVTVPTPEELQLFKDAAAPVYELEFFKNYSDIIEEIKNSQ